MPLPRKNVCDRGLIKAIVIIVIALLAISYFGLNLRDIIDQPNTHENFAVAWEWAQKGWNLVKGPILWVWDQVSELVFKSRVDAPWNATSTTP